MRRVHGALDRATDGKAEILPPETEPIAGTGTDAAQPAFSVPWTLDGEADPSPGRHPESTSLAAAGPAELKGLISWAGTHPADSTPSGLQEKLVGRMSSAGEATFSAAVEQYRKLAASLHYAQSARGVKAIIVTSAIPGEGKSLTASNLALTLSGSYQRRVLLIDGDLRRPSLHEIFGVPNVAGLSDGLVRRSIREIAVRSVAPRLSLLPSGPPIDDPTGRLTSDQMKRVLDEARARYDWVIFDTPPIALVSDAKLLSEMVDGVVLVVEAGRTGYPALLRAVETIGRGRVIGVVLNRAEPIPGARDGYSNYYSDNGPRPTTSKA